MNAKGGRKSQYPIFGRPCGRIAALLLARVARHTALRAPCTASRKRTQKRYIDYFRLPNADFSPRAAMQKSSQPAAFIQARGDAPTVCVNARDSELAL